MKLPEQAKLVHKGVIFDTHQWEQELYNGSTATFEMLKRPNTIKVIAIEDEQIVLVREQQPLVEPKVGLIGGRQDDGETPLACAQRELAEEVGLSSDDWELLRVYEPYTKIEWEVHVFVARDCKETSTANPDGGEKFEILRVSIDEFIDLACEEGFWEKELAIDILRMHVTAPEQLEAFKQQILG